jgi:hypothetical protein
MSIADSPLLNSYSVVRISGNWTGSVPTNIFPPTFIEFERIGNLVNLCIQSTVSITMAVTGADNFSFVPLTPIPAGFLPGNSIQVPINIAIGGPGPSQYYTIASLFVNSDGIISLLPQTPITLGGSPGFPMLTYKISSGETQFTASTNLAILNVNVMYSLHGG